MQRRHNLIAWYPKQGRAREKRRERRRALGPLCRPCAHHRPRNPIPRLQRSTGSLANPIRRYGDALLANASDRTTEPNRFGHGSSAHQFVDAPSWLGEQESSRAAHVHRGPPGGDGPSHQARSYELRGSPARVGSRSLGGSGKRYEQARGSAQLVG